MKVHPELAKALAEQEEPNLDKLRSIVSNWEKYEDNATALLSKTSKFHVGDIHDFLLDEPDSKEDGAEPVIKKVPLITDDQIKTSLNDQFHSEGEVNNLANKFQKNQTIASLQSGISINQRFVFMKELFGGEAEVYNATIERLDDASDLAEAELIIKKEAYSKYGWEAKEEVVEEFMGLLSRKY